MLIFFQARYRLKRCVFLVIAVLRACSGDLWRRDSRFPTVTNNITGQKMCASGGGSGIVSGVRYKGGCVLYCLEQNRCSGVNWKPPETCEAFSLQPLNMTAVNGCHYYSRGEGINNEIISTMRECFKMPIRAHTYQCVHSFQSRNSGLSVLKNYILLNCYFFK